MNPTNYACRLGLIFCILLCSISTYGQNAFTRGPFVQNATPTSIQVIWRTTNAASTCVRYGPTAALELFTTNAAPITNHVVTLSGLASGATYYYQVVSETSTDSLSSSPTTFRTLQPSGPVFFYVVSDSASGNPVTTNIVNRMLAGSPDLVLHCGDITDTSFPTRVDPEFFKPFQSLIKNVPFYLTPGNHDVDAGWSGDVNRYLEAFYLPTNAATGNYLYYSFDHGDVHFVSLYNPWFRTYVLTLGDTQYNWLTNDLAQSTKPWKILFCHFPAATCANHYSDNYNNNSTLDQFEVMAILAPLARQYGVQMIFNGHDHCFQRFAPTNGLHCIVNGSSGHPLYSFSHILPGLQQFWPTYSFLKVAITNDTLLLNAIDTNGLVFDSLTVQRAAPPRQTYPAAWHSVSIASGAANDGDGNILNQWFDFAGTPIFPKAGDQANLGQIYVNNDATNLYIGFKQVMMYPNHNLFLFVDSPRLTGVTSMAGLGNGLLDPSGQGADGLDCLENLAFTNFAPSVACLLGDEYADGQSRSFARSNLALNIGQGAFHLDQGLSDLAGIAIQQFNRSPQTGAIATPINLECNADFIEVAIPFGALGGVRPGDTIKLGAVVGTAEFNSAAQTRSLDTSFLGNALFGSGQGPVLLEGASIQLAIDPTTPRIALAALGGNQWDLRWNAVPGKTYDILYSGPGVTNFVWQAALTAETNALHYSISADGNIGFWRVRKNP